MRTQVAVIGAGPSGLMLTRLLGRAGIDTVLLERRSPEHVLGRVRAGVLESGSIDLLAEAGLADRARREGLVHDGVEFAFGGSRHRIDFKALTGRSVTVYGQTEVTRDLMAARAESNDVAVYEVESVALEGFDADRPKVTYLKDGARTEIACEFIAGCDGFRGISRQAVPAAAIRCYERAYDFAWMGVLSETRPVSDELIYANHERGFALCSMRSERLSRVYIQVPRDETVDNWPDDTFWNELRLRLDPRAAAALQTGPAIEKSVAVARSFVAEPMRFGRLFLVGDAAHIVPPTGAKGLNLAFSDVRFLAEGLVDFYRSGSTVGIDAYSERCLARVWKAERFSWWMTSLFHLFPETGAFGRRMQLAELDYIVHSESAATALAENYVGLPFT